MDTNRVLELAPHYAAMLILFFLVLAVARAAVGEISFWVEMAIILAIAGAYRPLVVRLGLAPGAWE